jgi:single-strand DNA-binding protein
MSENLAIVEGYLGADPELKYTPDGTPVAHFNVATTEKWTDKQSGDKKESTEWHRIEAWNSQGKACAENLKKGARVYVRGKLKTRSWEPQPGVMSYSTVIKARKVEFL